MENKKNIWMIDSTLRDGEQSPGVVFNLENKLIIANILDDAGINEVEVGIPSMGVKESNEISLINNHGFSFRVTTWCRALKKDISTAHSCGVKSIHISFPVSGILFEIMNKTEEIILNEMKEILLYACNLFEFVSIGAMDATRANLVFLTKFVKKARKYGAYRIRLADTVGIGTPNSTGTMIKTLISFEDKIEYEFHGHNDLGMATANSINAIDEGASAISSTVNGLGERAGNARLEELAAAIKYATDKNSSVDPSKIVPACDYLSKITGRPLSVDKPITGSHIFDHESGIHCSAILKNPISFQPFSPEEIGRKKGEFVIGKHSGRAVIKHRLKTLGITVTKENLYDILTKVREFAGEKGRAMTNAEILTIYHSIYN